MIIKLPIKLNDKIYKENFDLVIEKNIVQLNIVNNDSFVDVIYTNNYGINYYPIYFPLKFIITDNLLLNEYYFITGLLKSNIISDTNFFNILLEKINNVTNKKLNYIQIEKLNSNLIDKIISIVNNEINFVTKISNNMNFNELLKNIYNKYQFYLNISLSLILISNLKNEITNPSKRVKSCMNEIYNKNLFFYGINTTIKNHLTFINNKLKKKDITDQYLFVKNKKNKILKLFVEKIDDDYICCKNKKLSLDNYEYFLYPPKFKKNLNIRNLFYNLINDNSLFPLFKIIYKNNIDYIKLINYFSDRNYDCLVKSSFLKNLTLNDDNIIQLENSICDEKVSFDYFKKELKLLNFDKKIFIKLLKNYNYPLNYIKTDFSNTFKKILYFIYHFKDNVKKNKDTLFNTKYKNLFLFILLFYDYYSKHDLDIINNTKIYYDNLYFQIIYFHFFDIFNIFEKNNKFYNFKENLVINLKLYQIVSFLTWKNFKYNLDKLKYLSDNKNNKLVFYDKKIKKSLYINFDNNLLKIVYNPFIMCQFLIKKKDFIKWVNIFCDYINLIYDNIIKVKVDDYSKIGKILFHISNIEDQNMNNKKYKEIIDYLCVNSHLIIYNGRININIKEIFNNKNLNLGYLSKHILFTNIDSVVLSDSEENNDISEKYKSTKKKYYKYKSKYLELKTSEISSNINK